mmetsp:Transcript_21844/g.33827  ORF Transcript_21844/g.33827 Transcript_21844/m.33827 type:complete len:374 (-) Transcript_21844:2931-4052(-)
MEVLGLDNGFRRHFSVYILVEAFLVDDHRVVAALVQKVGLVHLQIVVEGRLLVQFLSIFLNSGLGVFTLVRNEVLKVAETEGVATDVALDTTHLPVVALPSGQELVLNHTHGDIVGRSSLVLHAFVLWDFLLEFEVESLKDVKGSLSALHSLLGVVGLSPLDVSFNELILVLDAIEVQAVLDLHNLEVLLVLLVGDEIHQVDVEFGLQRIDVFLLRDLDHFQDQSSLVVILTSFEHNFSQVFLEVNGTFFFTVAQRLLLTAVLCEAGSEQVLHSLTLSHSLDKTETGVFAFSEILIHLLESLGELVEVIAAILVQVELGVVHAVAVGHVDVIDNFLVSEELLILESVEALEVLLLHATHQVVQRIVIEHSGIV